MENWKIILISVATGILLFVMCLLGIQSAQNRAISFEENVYSAKSDIDVQMKRRVNVLSELAECVKQYDKHEYETLKDVITERGERITEVETEKIISQINAVAEAYPNLSSADNYKQLMNEISITENLISQHKQAYNNTIKEYKRYVRKFPARLWLSITGYEIVNYEYYTTDVTDNEPISLFGGNNE